MKRASPDVRRARSLLCDPVRSSELKREALLLRAWDLSERQMQDLELLLLGACSPLDGYLGSADHASVLERMRLVNGTLWPVPLVLDVTPEFGSDLAVGERVALLHPEGMLLAVLTVSEVWDADRRHEVEALFGSADERDPDVFRFLQHTHSVNLGGTVEGVEPPPRTTFQRLRSTPEALQSWFTEQRWDRIIAYPSRAFVHRAQVEQIRRAAQELEAGVLLQVLPDRAGAEEVEDFVRIRCHQLVTDRYLPDVARLNLVPLATRAGRGRDALWQAIVHRNFGCTHLSLCALASPKDESQAKAQAAQDVGDAGSHQEAAQEALAAHSGEIGIVPLAAEELAYSQPARRFVPLSQLEPGARQFTHGDLQRHLALGAPIPDWFTFREVVTELARRFPPRQRQGFTVFFTGLSGAGKSTIANTLFARLMEIGPRPVTLLDGDVVRKNLSRGLGFSKEHRDLNIRRIGFVASEITKNGGVAICAPIAPYRATRRDVRELIGNHGGFIEVFVDTPLRECERRDRKGLYAKARAGTLKNFTGIDDPYEVPEAAEIVIDTNAIAPEDAAEQVVTYLLRAGWLESDRGRSDNVSHVTR